MFANFIKIALRSLAKLRVLAFINIFGLSVGLACFSLFLLFAVNELSFDRFHKNAGSVYSVYQWIEGIKGKETGGNAWLSMPLGPAMKNDLPDVEDYVRYQRPSDEKYITADDKINRVGVTFADPDFFTVFTFPLVYGNPATALQDDRSVVVTEDEAVKLFGTTDAVGKRVGIKFNDTTFEPFTISAVAKRPPTNSTLQFDLVANFHYLENSPDGRRAANNWHMTGYQTFVKLREGSSLPNRPGTMARFREKYFPRDKVEFERARKAGIWDGKGLAPITFRLQPLLDIHTNMRINAGGDTSINPKYIWILLGIAGSVLIIACINFTTLAIGRSVGRAREIGVRKVMGGDRKQLIFQFLMESLMLSIFSTVLGLILAELLLPYFNNLANTHLRFSLAAYPELIWLFAGTAILTGIMAGSYPALVLSGFKAVNVLKNNIRLGGINVFTKSLVTLQFIISIGMMISTVIILQQLNYMRSRYLGFNKENVLIVDATGIDGKRFFPLFRFHASSIPEALSITSSDVGLGDQGYSSTSLNFNGVNEQVVRYSVSPEYVKVLGMQIVAGRDFEPNNPLDTVNSAVVNEAFVRDYGLTNNKALGLRLAEKPSDSNPPVIIGVVKDFNFLSLQESVKALMIQQPSDGVPSRFYVRLRPGNPSYAIDQLGKVWKDFAAGIPFKYSFLDESLDNFYKSEERWKSIFGWAGGISIFLSLLGLLGLSSLIAINRRKEIGIRKVVGASVPAIAMTLSWDILRLIIIAFVIAVPVVWYFMNHWLQNYAYRIHIDLIIFLFGGLTALMVAVVTVSYQVISVSIVNPISSLKEE